MRSPLLGPGLAALPGRLKEAFLRPEKPPGSRSKTKYLGWAFTALVSSYLVYKMTKIGWGKIWASIPGAPWFYVFVVAKLFVLPLTQALALKTIWGQPFRRLFPVSLAKGVLDKSVLDMSGDVYLFTWARKNIPASAREVLLALKDNLLLSSASSFVVSVLLLSAFLGLGIISLPAGCLFSEWRYAVLAAVACLAAGWVVFKFRKKIFFLKKRVLAAVFLLHFARGLVVQAFQVAQWAAAMPQVPLAKWLNLLAVQILVAFIPILPSRNLIFFGTGLALADRLALDTTELAGMFLAASVITQALNLGLFLWASLDIGRQQRGPGRRQHDRGSAEAPGREGNAQPAEDSPDESLDQGERVVPAERGVDLSAPVGPKPGE